MTKLGIEIDTDRFYYEPRAYWQVVAIESDEPGNTGLLARVKLDEQRFRNVSRFPVVLTHLLLSPIGYTVRMAPGQTPVDTLTFDCAASIINKIQVAIAAPFSVHFDAWDMATPGFTALPTQNPVPAAYSESSASEETPDLAYASDLFGVTRWDFEIPYEMPSKAACRLDISAWPCSSALTPPAVDVSPATAVLFNELTGSMGGHARLRQRAVASPAAGGARVYPKGSLLTPPDAFGVQGGGGTNDQDGVWDPAGLFQPKEYRAQENNRGGTPTQKVTGFAVAIDQIAHDINLAGSGSNISGFPAAPMAQRMTCRARTETGGTQEWWWEPNAPLALVSPSMTPALVKKLESPIVLQPGEGLQIEIQAPLETVVGEATIAPVYNVGISFTGFACVRK